MTTRTLRRSSDEYTGPPKEWFLGEEWHNRDVAAVFRPRWLLAGHVDELKVEGNGHPFITFSLGKEEVMIRRDEAGEIRAYHNVCPHRGAQLCQGPRGTLPSKRIVCPYHAWTYSVSDGALLSARLMHEEFDMTSIRLRPVHVDVWNGLIFVCLADAAPGPVEDYLRAATFGGFDITSMKLAAVKSHEIEANWKIVIENNLECYHCVVLHPELSAVYPWKTARTDDFDGDMAARAGGREVTEGSPFVSPLTIEGERVCSVPSPRADGDSDPASYWLLWEPGVTLNISRDCGWIFIPKPLGPSRTELRQYWLVAEEAEEGRDYDLTQLKRFWDTTMLQDREICESVQRGLEMPAYEPGPLNRTYQGGQAGFYAWYTEQLRAAFPAVVDGS